LWYALREKLPAAKFRRQVPFGLYFADFASHAAKLIVEVDGGRHTADRDAIRTAFLNSEGYRVMRFWNNEVLQNLEGVLAAISSQLPSPLVGEGGPKDRMRGARRSRARASGSHPSPQPSPTRGEGGNDKPPVWSS
jgi:very-short-patch-repair endonuclease